MNCFPILCIHSMVADGDGIDPLKTYRDTDCVGKFADHIEVEVKRLHTTFL